MNKELEFIDILKDGKFEAGGKEYFLEPHMSIERYIVANKLELEISYATTFKKHYADLNEIYGAINDGRLADASVKLNDCMKGTRRMDDKNNHHPVMKYAALILNTKDEDRRRFDEKTIEEKIENWVEAGIPVTSFFVVVLRSVNGLLEIYRQNTQSISPEKNG